MRNPKIIIIIIGEGAMTFAFRVAETRSMQQGMAHTMDHVYELFSVNCREKDVTILRSCGKIKLSCKK